MNVCYLKLSCCFSEKESPLNSFSPFLFREAENNLFLFLFFSFHFIMQHCFDYCWSPKPDKGLGLFQYRNITYLSVAKKRNNILNVEFIMECSKRFPIGYKPQRLVSEFRELDMFTMSSWGKPQCSIMSLLAAHEPQPFNKSSFQN